MIYLLLSLPLRKYSDRKKFLFVIICYVVWTHTAGVKATGQTLLEFILNLYIRPE